MREEELRRGGRDKVGRGASLASPTPIEKSATREEGRQSLPLLLCAALNSAGRMGCASQGVRGWGRSEGSVYGYITKTREFGASGRGGGGVAQNVIQRNLNGTTPGVRPRLKGRLSLCWGDPTAGGWPLFPPRIAAVAGGMRRPGVQINPLFVGTLGDCAERSPAWAFGGRGPTGAINGMIAKCREGHRGGALLKERAPRSRLTTRRLADRVLVGCCCRLRCVPCSRVPVTRQSPVGDEPTTSDPFLPPPPAPAPADGRSLQPPPGNVPRVSPCMKRSMSQRWAALAEHATVGPSSRS